MRVAFLHPDLGVGGAERLILDAAVGLQKHEHDVTVYTAHRDRGHCFPEARDGTLDVRVHGDWLPRSILGRLHIVFAIWRMLYCAMVIVLFGDRFDAIVVDQVSIAVWPLRWFTGARIIFYCHFPDMLLASHRSLAQRVYRYPFDKLEEWSTGAAHVVFVNSEFTADTVMTTFPSLRQRPRVLYPTLNLAATDAVREAYLATHEAAAIETNTVLFSLNRFERKKHIELALRAFALVRDEPSLDADTRGRLTLVLAGGYDPQNRENHDYMQELREEAAGLGLVAGQDVVFAPSITNEEKAGYFDQALAVLYTPHNEHFGIVPVEAMYAERPVIAVNSGGPTESVVDGETGFLCEQTPGAFADAIVALVADPARRREMGEAGARRVRQHYTLDAFSQRLNDALLPQ